MKNTVDRIWLVPAFHGSDRSWAFFSKKFLLFLSCYPTMALSRNPGSCLPSRFRTSNISSQPMEKGAPTPGGSRPSWFGAPFIPWLQVYPETVSVPSVCVSPGHCSSSCLSQRRSFSPLSRATRSTSSWVCFSLAMPVAMLVIQATPRTPMPR